MKGIFFLLFGVYSFSCIPLNLTLLPFDVEEKRKKEKRKKKTTTYAIQIHLAVITASSAVRIHRKGMPNRMTKHLLVYWN